MAEKFKKVRIGQSGISSLSKEKISKYISDICAFYKTDLIIDEIEIKPALPPNMDDKKREKLFNSCFGKGESRHHGYLKWFGYNFILNHALEFIDFNIHFERNIFIPNIIYWDKNHSQNAYGRLMGKEEDIGINWAPRNQSYGPMFWIQESDISFQSSFIIECGVTSNTSLSMPIITQAVSKIIWLPYQKNDDRKLEWVDFETPLKGFFIKRKEND